MKGWKDNHKYSLFSLFLFSAASATNSLSVEVVGFCSISLMVYTVISYFLNKICFKRNKKNLHYFINYICPAIIYIISFSYVCYTRYDIYGVIVASKLISLECSIWIFCIMAYLLLNFINWVIFHLIIKKRDKKGLLFYPFIFLPYLILILI